MRPDGNGRGKDRRCRLRRPGVRRSTAGQSLALQRDALAVAGGERFYEDARGGAAADRPGLARALEVLRAGDSLVGWKLGRVGRWLAHVVELVGSLQARGSASRCWPAASTPRAPPGGSSSASSPRWPSSSTT